MKRTRSHLYTLEWSRADDTGVANTHKLYQFHGARTELTDFASAWHSIHSISAFETVPILITTLPQLWLIWPTNLFCEWMLLETRLIFDLLCRCWCELLTCTAIGPLFTLREPEYSFLDVNLHGKQNEDCVSKYICSIAEYFSSNTRKIVLIQL